MTPRPHRLSAALALTAAVLLALGPGTAAEEPAATNAPDPCVVYYFHRTARCSTCLSMETWTRQAVAKANSGHPAVPLEWRAVNLDEPENAHFADDFQLTFGTVVVAETRAGQIVRWKNLDKVWEFSSDEATYSHYLESEFAPFFGIWR
jgi:hypothetical protein